MAWWEELLQVSVAGLSGLHLLPQQVRVVAQLFHAGYGCQRSVPQAAITIW